ncbi:mRNA capping enzyme-domain-containing protein [Talaromyces proteolyticus]|uniref:mRNA cap guanine-N(7) methyltransferase n=1 Tax=Talaromyces proteolyticus TaxID=1131652 RepID=A0AAD4KZY6_9EURO|nr:mRNA capping enzyme-domain-containing protein [Talaromyces proteolyticus]KAH8705018.1 mRNA capping enzyme-domain-containing protein [Talaromyces proteolyticus]
MEEQTAAKDGRRASMYDPARDSFLKEEQNVDRSAERDSLDQLQLTGTAASVDQQTLLHTTSSPTPHSPHRGHTESEALPNRDQAPHQRQRFPGVSAGSSPKPHSHSRSQNPSNRAATSTKDLSQKQTKKMADELNAPQAGGQANNTASVEPQLHNGSADAQAQSTDERKKNAVEDDNSSQPASQSSLKRRRREERHQRAPRNDAPSAYSRRDRSPRARRSESPRSRAGEFRRSRSPRPRDRSPTPEAQAKQRKRPGGGARMGIAGKDVLKRRQEERERAQQQEVAKDLQDRGVSDVVRQHYNTVPQRGREWRKTDSKIKGLRSFNNWIKSAVIQKFSPDEEFVAHKTGTNDWAADAGGPSVEEKKLLVVDLGCGKGGDLGKWQQAPQAVDLYVGLDPADISIDQARERYNGMRHGNRNPRNRRGNPLFHAEFATKDCFGEWLGDVRIIQDVGIDPNVGPDANLMNARWGGGGFDVVVSMFSMHYAFESETKARQMLKNVAGALKKGGRFIGVGPNSDVISAKVAEFHTKRKAEKDAAEEETTEDGEVEEDIPKWGNGIYRVRFPGKTPEDGIFRPPFGWKYSYFMEEAVEEIPEYVVPWEAFRYLTTEYNLELLYRRPFLDIWNEEKDDPELGPLSERMGVRGRGGGPILVTDEELEAASFYHAFVFHKDIIIMSSRVSSSRHSRHSLLRDTATPSRSAHRNNDGNRPPTPDYEPLYAPLNAAGQRALAALLSAPSFRQVAQHIQQASDKLTETAAEVNERATDARIQYESKKRKKLAARKKNKAAIRKQQGDDEDESNGEDGEDEEDVAELQRLEELERKVKHTTTLAEERMRGVVVDGEYRLSGLKNAIEGVHTEAEEDAAERKRQQRLRNRRHADEDEELPDADEEDEDEDEEPATVIPSQLLEEKIRAHQAEWARQSLTQRYAHHNNYIGFYRVVHDAKHPGNETPPVPHSSTWFSHLESHSRSGSASPTTGRIQTPSDDEDDDEIAIERERISLTCPLTLRTFEDPVKSTKCVHSFERQVIEDLIRNSSMTVAAGDQDFQGGGGRSARARRVRAVLCPVCSVSITLNELAPDPVMLRRVRRAKAAEQREEEEAQFGTGRHRKGGRKSGFTITSDDEDVSIDDDDDDDNDESSDEGDGRRAQSRVQIKREKSKSRFLSRAREGVDEIEDD